MNAVFYRILQVGSVGSREQLHGVKGAASFTSGVKVCDCETADLLQLMSLMLSFHSVLLLGLHSVE